jgi:hypothetical protein
MFVPSKELGSPAYPVEHAMSAAQDAEIVNNFVSEFIFSLPRGFL